MSTSFTFVASITLLLFLLCFLADGALFKMVGTVAHRSEIFLGGLFIVFRRSCAVHLEGVLPGFQKVFAFGTIVLHDTLRIIR